MQTLQESITQKRVLEDIPHYDRAGHIFVDVHVLVKLFTIFNIFIFIM